MVFHQCCWVNVYTYLWILILVEQPSIHVHHPRSIELVHKPALTGNGKFIPPNKKMVIFCCDDWGCIFHSFRQVQNHPLCGWRCPTAVRRIERVYDIYDRWMFLVCFFYFSIWTIWLPFFFQPTYLLLVRCFLGRQISPGIYIIMIVYFHHNILTPDNSYKWYTIPRIYVGRYDIQLIYYIVAPKHIEQFPSKPWVRPHSNNLSKQYDILITRGWMKTLAIRSDLSFQDLGF